MKNIALITSTIAPDKNAHALKVIDPEERLEEYIAAFNIYLKALKNGIFDKIAYVDNSQYPLTKLIQMAENENLLDRVEFISYKSGLDPSKHGRFFLELNLIDYFKTHSKLLNKNEDIMIWKITGRYQINNISEIILRIKQKGPYDLAINYRSFPRKWVDFYLVGFNLHAYELLFSNNIELFGGKKDGESVLREKLDKLELENLKILKRFPYIPHIMGRRGYDGASYNQGKELIKYHTRRVLNKLAPSLWI